MKEKLMRMLPSIGKIWRSLADFMKGRRARLLRLSLWSLLALTLLAVAAWTMAHVVADSRLEGVLEELRKAGYATTMNEQVPFGVIPHPLDPRENGAPYFTAAFALWIEPDPDTAESYARALDNGFSSLSREEKDKLGRWLDENEEAFSLLSRAAVRPGCQFERDYSQGYSMLMPEVTKAIRMAKMLQLRAQRAAEQGKEDVAQGSMRHIFALADSVKEEPILVSQLVRLIVVGTALESVDRCVTSETSEEDLRAWLGLLPNENLFDHTGFERGMRGELAMSADLLRNLDTVNALGYLRGRSGWLMRPILKWDGASHLLFLRRGIESGRKPYSHYLSELTAIEREIEETRWRRPVTSMLMPAVLKANVNRTNLQAKLAVVRSGLRHEIARSSQGTYPDHPEGTDPFTDKPLLYQPVQGRIVSVGADGREEISEDDATWMLRHKP